ncbi:hypothetical protein [Colwellia hornerae]|uniref:Uncharacterized protein n=1 Tax=Colwellia hornerae TaxID=89402 RepID=A0A5C6QC13_9GAMM|nr:hypothetical protein [Colwellia hornerae]TWX53003.1 hypothetical protein ESZ28_10485 [Colwellia hornerae]TWX59266.1 hypothetical protein ESZ26_09865 [Colwellia hornerae]TWX66152.1 hypothetical protein ESZ27_11010 [Colwellia hornerae]
MYKIHFQIFFISLALTFSHQSYAEKKHCQFYADKLHNIQSQQRQGHSLKRSESLKKQQESAREKWWQCQQGQLKKPTSNKQNIQKKKQRKNSVKGQHLSGSSASDVKKTRIEPFETSAALVLKSRYQGKKLQAWLEYYQQPKQCSRPKTIKKFAFCVENRRTQQLAFDKMMLVKF